jgi:hypothetical protein
VVPYHVRSAVGHFIMLIRWPVFIGLTVASILQVVAAFTPILKPDQMSLPDVIPPINTAVLALLWWRITQLEKNSEYLRDRMDRMSSHQDTQDHRAGQPKRIKHYSEPE